MSALADRNVLIYMSQFGGRVFSTHPLTLDQWGWCVLIGAGRGGRGFLRIIQSWGNIFIYHHHAVHMFI